MPPTPEQFAAMEQWLGKVRGTLIALGDFVPSAELRQASELIEHGEPAEGLIDMAWVITESHIRVPSGIIDAIYELGSEINDPDHLPPNLRDFAVDP